jgi:tellurite resistance protein
MNTMQDQNLTPAEVTQLTKAMLSVALVDGIHPAEAALIGQFYESSRSADMPTTATVMASPDAQSFDVASLVGSPATFADILLLMCLMTAYADGQLSLAEKNHIHLMATTLGVDAQRFDDHLAHVRDELVGALSHLPDAGSVAMVVKELAAND